MDRQTKNAEQRFLNLIAGPPRSISDRILHSMLRIASWGYRCGVTIRNTLFDLEIKRSHKATVPVISVGNLTTGGTGKTPTVALLIGMLKELGHQPGIISRGYRELSEGGNDEARVLEMLCPGTPHIQNRDRVAAARKVTVSNGCSVIIADDAFQHRRLKRDVDIVLIDALNPWGHDALLPRGLLREPISGLRRANIVALTRADLIDETARAEIWNVVSALNSATANIEIAFSPGELVDKAGQQKSADCSSALAFCGIGNPDGFRRTLESAGISSQNLIAFPDHHHYDQADLRELTAMADNLGAETLITTVKDLVKIEAEWISSVPVVALNIKAQITSGEELLRKALTRATQPETL